MSHLARPGIVVAKSGFRLGYLLMFRVLRNDEARRNGSKSPNLAGEGLPVPDLIHYSTACESNTVEDATKVIDSRAELGLALCIW